ncbi:NrfD/PsrC family molybdoenzyme membrane anchor subunit [Tepidibacillus infernus]|uniref:NrfD/PsrC family molybdoenzyme membrane anchor subunit n=1 Tax=Tepidibacillus TaxID=1494427 RepID=UPI000857A4E3|nr:MULTISPECIES: NrfD/PsrC family molybdoenzyme membrane anchor subunit [Tepidibacillus]GBF11262.1 putative hydrogenase 2 b cytochrome subunit [Tepidibacillus sp. HK-1]
MGEFINLNYLYNVEHEIPLGYLISVYFFYTGLSAGSFLLSSLSSVLGIKKYKPIAKIGTIMALALLVVAPLHLIVDLEQPSRFWHLFVYFNPTSPITYGSFLLTLYPLMTAIYAWFMFRKDFALGSKALTNWRGKLYKFLSFGHLETTEESYKKDEKWVKRLGTINVPLALLVHGYTGFILANVQARGLWNTALMPFIFLMSAIVSGTGLLLILTMIAERYLSSKKRITEERKELIFDIAKMMVWFILVDAVLLIVAFIVLFYAGTNAYETAWQMLHGEHRVPFLLYEVTIGLLIPFIMFSIPKIRKTYTGITIASLMTLFGVMAMRMNFVVGGLQLQLDGNGWTEYIPNPTHLAFIFTFAALEIILLAVLFYVLPITEEKDRYKKLI